MNSSNESDEVGEYLAAVRAALVGLPEATVAELLDDLPEHLAEVRAEGNGTLVERLGTPQAYAAELRTTAGFVGGFPDPPQTPWVASQEVRKNLQEMRANGVQMLGRADAKLGPVIGYEKFSDFLVLLRPGWWVLRGYLAAMALALLLANNRSDLGLLPRLGDNGLVAILLLAACIIASIAFGKRSSSMRSWVKYAVGSGTAVLVVFAWVGFITTDSRSRDFGYNTVSNYNVNPYSNVQDVYVYDSNNHLIKGARLYDQDGAPIELGLGGCVDPNTGQWLESRRVGYPRCVQIPSFDESSAPADSSSTSDPSSAADPNGPSAAEPSQAAPSAGRHALPAKPSAHLSPSPAPSS